MKTTEWKLFVWCLTMAVVAGCATNKGPVISVPELRLVERKPGGECSLILKRYFRGKEKIYDERLVNPAMRLITKGYYVGGKLVMVESDEDGDEFFETVTLFPDDLDKMEVFLRQRDGSVKPMDSDELRKLKMKIIRAIGEFKNAQKSD